MSRAHSVPQGHEGKFTLAHHFDTLSVIPVTLSHIQAEKDCDRRSVDQDADNIVHGFCN